jgi:hypothetical protein
MQAQPLVPSDQRAAAVRRSGRGGAGAFPAAVGDHHRKRWRTHTGRCVGTARAPKRPPVTGPVKGSPLRGIRPAVWRVAVATRGPGRPRRWPRDAADRRHPRRRPAAARPRLPGNIAADYEDGLLVVGELAPVRVAAAGPVGPAQAFGDYPLQALLAGGCHHQLSLVDEAGRGLPGRPANSSASNAARRSACGWMVSSRPSSHSRSKIM